MAATTTTRRTAVAQSPVDDLAAASARWQAATAAVADLERELAAIVAILHPPDDAPRVEQVAVFRAHRRLMDVRLELLDARAAEVEARDVYQRAARADRERQMAALRATLPPLYAQMDRLARELQPIVDRAAAIEVELHRLAGVPISDRPSTLFAALMSAEPGGGGGGLEHWRAALQAQGLLPADDPPAA